MRLIRVEKAGGSEYRTVDGEWRVWQEPYSSRRWFVNSTDPSSDCTAIAEGFRTLAEAKRWLERNA